MVIIWKLRWWLIRKLIGRSSVMANVRVEIGGSQVEMAFNRGLSFGNAIFGHFTTETNDAGVTRIILFKNNPDAFKGLRRKADAPAMVLLHPDCSCDTCKAHFWEPDPDYRG